MSTFIKTMKSSEYLPVFQPFHTNITLSCLFLFLPIIRHEDFVHFDVCSECILRCELGSWFLIVDCVSLQSICL